MDCDCDAGPYPMPIFPPLRWLVEGHDGPSPYAHHPHLEGFPPLLFQDDNESVQEDEASVSIDWGDGYDTDEELRERYALGEW